MFEYNDLKAFPGSGFQGSPSLHFRNELCYWQNFITLWMAFEGLLTLDSLALEFWFIKAFGRKNSFCFGRLSFVFWFWEKMSTWNKAAWLQLLGRGEKPRLPGDKAIRKLLSSFLPHSSPSFPPSLPHFSFSVSFFLFWAKISQPITLSKKINPIVQAVLNPKGYFKRPFLPRQNIKYSAKGPLILALPLLVIWPWRGN